MSISVSCVDLPTNLSRLNNPTSSVTKSQPAATAMPLIANTRTRAAPSPIHTPSISFPLGAKWVEIEIATYRNTQNSQVVKFLGSNTTPNVSATGPQRLSRLRPLHVIAKECCNILLLSEIGATFRQWLEEVSQGDTGGIQRWACATVRKLSSDARIWF